MKNGKIKKKKLRDRRFAFNFEPIRMKRVRLWWTRAFLNSDTVRNMVLIRCTSGTTEKAVRSLLSRLVRKVIHYEKNLRFARQSKILCDASENVKYFLRRER